MSVSEERALVGTEREYDAGDLARMRENIEYIRSQIPQAEAMLRDIGDLSSRIAMVTAGSQWGMDMMMLGRASSARQATERVINNLSYELDRARTKTIRVHVRETWLVVRHEIDDRTGEEIGCSRHTEFVNRVELESYTMSM